MGDFACPKLEGKLFQTSTSLQTKLFFQIIGAMNWNGKFAHGVPRYIFSYFKSLRWQLTKLARCKTNQEFELKS